MKPSKQKKTTAPPPAPMKGASVPELLLSPHVHAAAGMEAYGKAMFGETDLVSLVQQTRDAAKTVSAGDMRPLEAMLYGQAAVLQTIFTSLARRAGSQEYLKPYQTYLTLALKAQGQCRATIEALAEIRNPRPVAFVKQANIAQGPQQVNNGVVPSRAEKEAATQNELLEVTHERMDPRAQTPAGRAHSTMETVGAVNGTTDR